MRKTPCSPKLENARGLPPELARRLLVQAFIGDALVALGDDAEHERLLQVALGKLDSHL